MLRDRLAATNQIRAFLQENGIVVPTGKAQLKKRMPEILENLKEHISEAMRKIISRINQRSVEIDECLIEVDREIKHIAKTNHDCQRLMSIPGIGPLSSTAMIASVGDGSDFTKARELAAWLGLVPRQHSTGGKTKLLGITKTGNSYVRRLLIHGARSVIVHSHRGKDRLSQWITSLECRVHSNKVTVALANKLARICWAVLRSGGFYKQIAT